MYDYYYNKDYEPQFLGLSSFSFARYKRNKGLPRGKQMAKKGKNITD